MEIFNIQGGARLDGRKSLTAHLKILTMPTPDILHVPLQQHIGAPAEPIVSHGDYVLKGQLIADSKGVVSAPVHAPTSGTVKRIGDFPAPHPSGLPVLTLTLEPDGLDKWVKLPEPLDMTKATSQEIADRVAQAGIVGMGGATFPSAVKLNLGQRYNLEMLVINGAECEPYLTCDDRLMQERTEKTIIGIKAMMQALGVSKSLVAIEANKPEAFKAMEEGCANVAGIDIVHVPARYPMGSEKHLVQALTGKETPAKGMTADLGIVVHNVATAYAVYEAVYLGRPLISRIVTVSGEVIRKPGNYDTLIGTPVSSLIEMSGGMSEEPKQLLMGGPMMGQPIPELDVPIIKGSSGILALKDTEMKDQNVMPCIGCGSCVTVCPVGLLPLDLAARIGHEDVDGADSIGVRDCVSCGSCNYVCPSHIPLVQYFNYAKGRLKEQDIERKNQDRMKILAEKRALRDENDQLDLERKRADKTAFKQAMVKMDATATVGQHNENAGHKTNNGMDIQ
ncbi:MAG: electron transport complex subunit RsxC [Emcibacter sp.]|nr:electron transport complex subunit RsxC [Emcibacter sp.]